MSKLGGEGEGDVGGYPMAELIKREGVEVVEGGKGGMWKWVGGGEGPSSVKPSGCVRIAKECHQL